MLTKALFSPTRPGSAKDNLFVQNPPFPMRRSRFAQRLSVWHKYDSAHLLINNRSRCSTIRGHRMSQKHGEILNRRNARAHQTSRQNWFRKITREIYRTVVSRISEQPHSPLIGTLETIAIAEAFASSPSGTQIEMEGAWHEVTWVGILVDR